MLLYLIENSQDALTSLFADDPVRPSIPTEFRCRSPENCVFVLLDDQTQQPRAVLCCSFKNAVPSSLAQLLCSEESVGQNAIFYTVWSYQPGSGRAIILAAQNWIRLHRAEVAGFYTYSPPGRLVREFHLGLGARLYRTNTDSVNYVY